MSLATAPIEDDILAVLRTTVFQVFDSEAPEDSVIPVTNGLFSPYLSVYFGGPISAPGDKHLTSNRNDTTIVTCTVQVNAARSSEAKSVKDIVVNLLTGHTPPDAGSMTLEGGMGYSKASTIDRPTVYIRELAFSMRANLTFVA